jgi:S1-C subfamily serine protease
MLALLLLALDFPVVDAPQFPRALQQAALAATVRIENLTRQVEGSGAVVAVEGPFMYVLTAGHNVRDGKDFIVSVFDAQTYPKAKQEYAEVKVVAQSQGVKDLALLRVLIGKDQGPAPVAIRPKPRKLDLKNFTVLTVGCSKGSAPTCLVEKVEAAKLLARSPGGEKGKLWDLPAAQAPGRSGGPMLDSKGQVIGICSGNNNGRGYFCHLEEIEAFLMRHQFGFLLKDAP